MRFEKFKAMDKCIEYGTEGTQFFVIISGLVQAQIPNPAISNWSVKYREYEKMLRWKKDVIDKKIQQAE